MDDSQNRSMPSSEVYQEIGRLKQQVEYLQEAVQVLREEKEILDQANQVCSSPLILDIDWHVW